MDFYISTNHRKYNFILKDGAQRQCWLVQGWNKCNQNYNFLYHIFWWRNLLMIFFKNTILCFLLLLKPHTKKTFSILFPFLKLESAKWDLFFVELLPGLSINSICSVYFLQVRPDMINYFWTPDIIIHDLIKYGPLPSLQRKSC